MQVFLEALLKLTSATRDVAWVTSPATGVARARAHTDTKPRDHFRRSTWLSLQKVRYPVFD